MAEEMDQHSETENLEVEPLSDEDLEAVPGGSLADAELADCSCGSTGGNCTS